jgi:hypothetical protein
MRVSQPTLLIPLAASRPTRRPTRRAAGLSALCSAPGHLPRGPCGVSRAAVGGVKLSGVKDEERRGHVVKWIQDIGDPWMKSESTPAPGSDLADDRKTEPTIVPMTLYGLVTAIDHLGAVVDAMMNSHTHDQPMRHYAHLTTLRTTLLASTRVRWVIEPTERGERQLRALRCSFQNLVEQRKAVKASAGAHLDATQEQARLKAIASMDAYEVKLDARAKALGATGVTNPPNMVDMLSGHVASDTWLGAGVTYLWRSGSAAAHGYHWADLFRPQPGVFNLESFNSALYGGFIALKHTFELYEKRSAPPTS